MITGPLFITLVLVICESVTAAFVPQSNTPYTTSACTATSSIRLRQNQLLQKHNPYSNINTYNLDLQMSTSSSSSSENLDSKPVGKDLLSKIGSSTSMVVAGTFFLALAYQRDDYMITFFIGSILNGISSKILKRVLNVDRPDGYQTEDSVKVKPSDKGMPSSHAMSLGFIGTYCIIQAFQSLGVGLESAIISFVLVVYAAISLVYRVQSKLHTVDQIVVGLGFGITNSFMWHSLAFGENFLLPSINLMELVSSRLLPDNGILPLQFMVIPAIVGGAVVGSLERRISAWLDSRKKSQSEQHECKLK